MNIFRQLTGLPTFQNAVITIGTYDGVHIGHQKIIHRINTLAKKIKGESILITFHPHPRMVVNDNYKIELLSPLEEKFELLEKFDVDNVVVVPFTRSFSEQSPRAYITDFLVKNFQPKKIVIGYNHRFGKNRAGDLTFLQEVADSQGFIVEEISKQEVDDLGVSSTKIRKALAVGDVTTANNLLGHTYFIQGIVVKGQQLGQRIGFPTANVSIEETSKLVPENGVYAVRIKVRNTIYQGMLNIGLRPTIANNPNPQKTTEVHIFDFNKNIYGENIKIYLEKRMRNEQKFHNLNALMEQLKKDEISARAFLQKK